MSIRYVGFCAVCERRIKVRGDVLVHHGYQRPGDGQIHGDCFAVGMQPHETSPAAAEAFKAYIVSKLEDLAKSQKSVEQATELTHSYTIRLAFREKKLQTVSVRQGDGSRYEGAEFIPSFDDVKKQILGRIDSQMRAARSSIERMDGLLAGWTEEPLTTLEEETRRVTAEKNAARDLVKAERDAKKAVQGARKAARDEKLQQTLTGFQQRAWKILDAVDSSDVAAVRNAYLQVLAIQLPVSLQYTFYDKHLNRTELLKSAGLVREHNGTLMRFPWEVQKLIAAR